MRGDTIGPTVRGGWLLLACAAVDDRIGLVFSWDPRQKAWIRERGPEDAAAPPAPPRDPGAVQTYFLDPQTGRWHSTILGLRARQISEELGRAYRAPFTQGLDLAEGPIASIAAPRPLRRPSRAPLLVGGAALALVLAGGAVFAAQSLLAPATARSSPTPSQGGGGGAPSGSAGATATPSAGPSSSAAVTAAPPGSASPAPPPPTARRTPAPAPTTITVSTALPDGYHAFYIGPNAVPQGSSFSATVQIFKADGTGATTAYTFFVGALSGGSTTVSPDASGRYQVALRASTAPGAQGVNMLFRTFGIQRIATIDVRQ